MSTEIWRPIPVADCSHLYSVSNHGRIHSRISNRIITGSITSEGYRRILISAVPGHRNKRSYYIHRLVCEAFNGKPLDGQQVDHVDGDKLNNWADNLEWVECLENIRRAIENGVRPSQRGVDSVRAKLTAEQVRVIRSTPPRHGVLTELARRYGVSREVVSRARKGTTYRNVK
jgi:hypothetical protein